MGYVDHIVSAFGGIRAMASALRRPPSTVHSWKDRGSIPDDSKPAVLAAADRLGLGLSRADFFPWGDSDEAATPSEDAA